MNDFEPTATSGRKMRLIGLMNSFTRGMSGGDLWFIEVMKRLLDYELIVITSKSGVEVCSNYGLNHCKFKVSSSEKRQRLLLLTYLIRTFRAILTIRAFKVDVIYSSSDFFPDVFPAVWCKMVNRKCIWVQKVYHLVPRKRFAPWLMQKISHAVARLGADLVLVDNNDLARQLISFGFSPNRVHVCSPGVSVDDVPEENPQIVSNRSGAVYLGRIHHAKGMKELIEIWSVVCQLRPSSHLRLVGTGDAKYIRSLQQFIESLGLANYISLLGFQDDLTVTTVLKESRVYVTASREEGFGMSVLEALAVGTPVVCWDIPAFREAFGDAVSAVPVGDRDLFAERVVKLLMDDSCFQERAEFGRRAIMRYSWEFSADRERSLINLAFLHGFI